MIRLVQEYFMNAAVNFPQKTAVNYEKENITYNELDTYSTKLANLLIKLGLKRNDRVTFCLPKSINSIKSILGILKADGCYVPLDIKSPLERLFYVVEDCRPAVLICDRNTLGMTSKLLDRIKTDTYNPKIIVLSPKKEDGLNDQQPVFFEDDILIQSTSCPHFQNKGYDLAYILYTSGSTGKPKGVMINHTNIIHFIEWSVSRFEITYNDILSNHAPIHFDLSTFDFYCAFKVGATLVLVPPELNLFPEKIVSFIEEKELTVWLSVPNVLAYLARMEVLESGRMPKLRIIFSTGEVFPTPYLVQWMKIFPEKVFVNMFGPTETTVECTYYVLEEIPTDLSKNIPIGKACEHLDVFAINEKGVLAEVGEVGELCVRGPSVSLGYWDNSSKTQQAFVKNPLFPDLNDLVYKTGDLVQLREDGNYILKGRKDHQIKFMGYRIELGEIEAALYSLDYIKEVAVLFDDSQEMGEIVGFFSLKEDREINQIKEDLLKKIPKYMVPRKIIITDSFPRTSTGKVDRIALKNDYEIREK